MIKLMHLVTTAMPYCLCLRIKNSVSDKYNFSIRFPINKHTHTHTRTYSVQQKLIRIFVCCKFISIINDKFRKNVDVHKYWTQKKKKINKYSEISR